MPNVTQNIHAVVCFILLEVLIFISPLPVCTLFHSLPFAFLLTSPCMKPSTYAAFLIPYSFAALLTSLRLQPFSYPITICSLARLSPYATLQTSPHMQPYSNPNHLQFCLRFPVCSLPQYPTHMQPCSPLPVCTLPYTVPICKFADLSPYAPSIPHILIIRNLAYLSLFATFQTLSPSP